MIIHFFIRRRLGGFDVVLFAAWAAVFGLVSGLLAGGNVGAYGWIGPSPWIFMLAAAAWVGGIAGATWLIASFTRPRVEEEEMLDGDPQGTPAPKPEPRAEPEETAESSESAEAGLQEDKS